jgi:hypothetical protein
LVYFIAQSFNLLRMLKLFTFHWSSHWRNLFFVVWNLRKMATISWLTELPSKTFNFLLKCRNLFSVIWNLETMTTIYWFIKLSLKAFNFHLQCHNFLFVGANVTGIYTYFLLVTTNFCPITIYLLFISFQLWFISKLLF